MAALRDTSTGREYPLRGPSMTVGRSVDCDIHINNPQGSGRHAMILCTDDTFYLSDLGSSNGTQVNGRRITESTRLRSGDMIDLCGPVFAFVEHAGGSTV